MNEISAMIGSIVRHAVSGAGVWLVAQGLADDSMLTAIAGGAAAIAMIGWALIQKKFMARLIGPAA